MDFNIYIYISYPEFPYPIQNFNSRSGISISDPEFPYMIQNFHIRSGTSISDPESPYPVGNQTSVLFLFPAR